MKNARLLVVLLVIATVLVDAVALSIAPFGREYVRPPGSAELFLLSLGMGQVSLVAIWAALGGGALPWRVLALALTVMAWARLLAWSLFDAEAVLRGQTLYNSLLAAQSAGVVLPLFVARFARLEITRASEVHRTDRMVAGSSRLQFSLRYLLSWITVVAVVLGLSQYAFDYRSLWAIGAATWRELAVLSLGDAVLALAAFWVALGARRPVLRAIALPVTTAAVIAMYYTHLTVPQFRMCAELCVVQVVWLVGSLWVFRVAGYRIAWRQDARRAP
jgi:hypothetical protein